MNVQLIKAIHEHKAVIKNLMQFYMYDFSEYVNIDVKEDGLYAAYDTLEDYWKDENRFAYIIKNNEQYAGFVLVKWIETSERNYFSIAEFFVMKRYRREGIGKAVAEQIFNLHKGQWEVFQKENNKPAQLFWTTIINFYTNSKFTDKFENGRRIQNFESL